MARRFDDSGIEAAAEQIARLVRESSSTVAFTGAGISTESGIPDFRSPGGVWSKNRTVYFDEFLHSADARHEYWRQKAEAHADFADAQPNITHRTLAGWEQRGWLRGVITQNIDGLHQDAGNESVLELHGTARQIACMDCTWREPAEPWVQQFREQDTVPDCPSCRGRLKHATISFGQSLSPDVLQAASQWSSEAELYFALGSSLVVEPAASLPRLAVSNGATLVIVNRDPTPLDGIATLVVNAPLGELFNAVGEQITSGA